MTCLLIMAIFGLAGAALIFFLVDTRLYFPTPVIPLNYIHASAPPASYTMHACLQSSVISSSVLSLLFSFFHLKVAMVIFEMYRGKPGVQW